MKRLIGKSEFTKNFITLLSGTTIAQILAFAASPILSRLFTPEDFAPFTLFVAIVGIIVAFATGRFEMAILLPKKENDAKSLIALALLLSLSTAILALIGVFLYDIWLYQYWPTQKFSSWFYLLAPTIFILGGYNTMNYWSTRNSTFKNNAIGRVLITATVASVSIFFGLFHFVSGLIIAFVLGNLAGLFALSIAPIKEGRKFFSSVTKVSIKSVFKKHVDFARINVPHALVDTLQENGVVFFIAYFFTESLVGLYGFAFRILKAPIGLIGDAFYQVFYQNITQNNYDAARIRKMVTKVYRRSFLVGIIPFATLFFFAPEIFSFIFGAAWREAGVITQILTPWLFLHFIVSPVSCLPLYFNKQRKAFILTCIGVVLKYVLLIGAGIYYDFYLAFIFMSILGSALMLYSMVWYLSIVKDENHINE